MKKLLIFNWKENPNSIEEAEKILASVLALAKNAKETEMVVCPPDVYLEHVSQVIGQKSEVRLGAQNLSTEESGAHTGEISGGMLKNLGVTYVIVGHSERRRLGETDEIVAKKISVAIKDGLVPILCVGEELEVRNQGMDVVKDFIKNQLDKDLPRDSASSQRSSALLVAYEPIWAIGTGKPCEPKDAAEVIRFIKETRSEEH